MSYPEFAYSGKMQAILAVITFACTFIFMYLIAELIMWVYNDKAAVRQKLLFAFFTGTLMQNVPVYGAYLIGGMVSFSPTAHLLITTPNPVFALLICVIGVKLLSLPPARAMKIMGNLYLYYMFVRSLFRLVNSLFFLQTEMRYNYLLDAMHQVACLILSFLLFFAMRWLLRNFRGKLNLSDNLFAPPRTELTRYVTRTMTGWLMFVLAPLAVSDAAAAGLIASALILLVLAVGLLLDYTRALEVNLDNSSAHIHALSTSMNSLSGVKHDFYNILQTYGGYLSIGDLDKLKDYHQSLVHTTTDAGADMELGNRLQENPAFVSLLINKVEYAKSHGVELKINLKGSLDTFYMDNVDLCRIVACLLDNAIEAAAASPRKTALVTVEDKSQTSKLLVISNSTAIIAADTSNLMMRGVTTKAGHSGIGLANVRTLIEKYNNCMFKLSSYNDEFSAYLEVRREM